jgi:hypothetical protein
MSGIIHSNPASLRANENLLNLLCFSKEFSGIGYTVQLSRCDVLFPCFSPVFIRKSVEKRGAVSQTAYP